MEDGEWKKELSIQVWNYINQLKYKLDHLKHNIWPHIVHQNCVLLLKANTKLKQQENLT